MILLPRIFKAPQASMSGNVLLSVLPVPVEEPPKKTQESPKQPNIQPAAAEVSEAQIQAAVEQRCAQALETARTQAKVEAEQLAFQTAQKAQAERELLLEQARQEAEQIREQARMQGIAQGKEEAQLRVQEALDQLAAALDRLDDTQREWLDGIEKDIRLSVIEVIKKMTGKLLAEDDRVLAGMVDRALSNFKNTDWVKITVSDTDAQTSCITDKQMLADLLGVSGPIELEILNDAAQGLCVVETPDGIADASVAAQLQNLRDILERG